MAQSDWMALNKSKSWWALTTHVMVYASWLLAIVGWVEVFPTWVLVWAATNGALHFLVDAITSRINARLWAADARHWFFVSIGFDQFLHVAFLLWSWDFLSKVR